MSLLVSFQLLHSCGLRLYVGIFGFYLQPRWSEPSGNTSIVQRSWGD